MMSSVFFSMERVDEFKDFLNKIEPRIQWTHEIKANGILNFMDMSVWCNEEGKLRTKVYRKKSHTLKYSNFRQIDLPAHSMEF